MDTFSDIAGLFSKLPYDVSQYQEIGNFQETGRVGSRWTLLAEISRSITQSGSDITNPK
jgi:hypothetical protein